MLLYERLLNYYLSSDDFTVGADLFFDCYYHVGQCLDDRNGHWVRFETRIYRQISKRIKEEQGYHLQLTDQKIKQYFGSYQGSQLFDVIFAEWYGLSEKQIHQIACYCPTLSCPSGLDFFLRYPQEGEISIVGNDHTLYYVQTDAEKQLATVKNGRFTRNEYDEPLLSSFEFL